MLIAAGVSHRTAKLDERERVALQRDEVPQLLQRYRERYGNGVVLATCNRTEVYVHTGQRASEAPPGELMEQLADFKGLSFPGDLPAYYCLQGAEVPRHLFSVASGIDSQVLGEGQILGQVREALSAAAEARSLDAALARLLHDALRTGKRARSETPIGRYAVSVSSAAVDLAREHVPALPYCRALVVGAGAAGMLAARALRDRGIQHLTVTSRTRERAEGLAEYLGAAVVPFPRLADAIAAADLVITSSSAPGFLIDPPLVERARAIRVAPRTFIDVAVPRDVDPRIREFADVRVFDLDDLQGVSAANLQPPSAGGRGRAHDRRGRRRRLRRLAGGSPRRADHQGDRRAGGAGARGRSRSHRARPGARSRRPRQARQDERRHRQEAAARPDPLPARRGRHRVRGRVPAARLRR